MTVVVFTSHALGKFEILKAHGFQISHSEVEKTVLEPDRVIPQPAGRSIAQRVISSRHVLRVVYREEGENRVVITFYPGRRERYEN